MKKVRVLLAGVTITWLLSGCGGDGGGGITNFTGFVKGLVANTNDTAEPVDINNKNFRFTEDETVFDDLF